LKKISFKSVVVENLVEFWRWQSKVIEKKLQEIMTRKVIFSRHHNNVVSYIHTIILLHISVH
jgi:hypothetical protein